ERPHLFRSRLAGVVGRLGAADNNFVVADFVVIESVERMAELEHHVIGNIDDIADAGDTGSFKAVFQPFWGRLNIHVSNDAGREAAAEFGGLDFDSYGVARLGGAFRWFRRNMFQRELVNGSDFTGDAVVAQAIRAIGTDFGVDDGPVQAGFAAGNVRSRERETRGKLLRHRGQVDEVFQPVVNNLHLFVLSILERTHPQTPRVVHPNHPSISWPK